MAVIGNTIKALVAVAMIGAVIVAGVFLFRLMPTLLPGGNGGTRATGPVTFVIEQGQTVGQVADNLQRSGIIDNTLTFRLRLKLLDAETKIQAGTYTLTPGMDLDALIRVITTPVVEVGVKFTVIEGMRLEEIADRLGSQNVVSATEFLRRTTTPDGAAAYEDDFIKSSGKPADKGLEGFLFPDTYEVKQSGGDNSDAVIKVMLGTLEERITPEMRTALEQRTVDGKPATIYEMLTIASIVQREGVVKEELPDIAQVFWNRLDKGMLFNADPTIQYAVGKTGQWWPVLTLEDLKVDNPYNSYTNVGLPPGPICNPGLDAIRATIAPSGKDYLYFVAKNDGSNTHAFASTLEEHERNRVLYGNR